MRVSLGSGSSLRTNEDGVWVRRASLHTKVVAEAEEADDEEEEESVRYVIGVAHPATRQCIASPGCRIRSSGRGNDTAPTACPV